MPASPEPLREETARRWVRPANQAMDDSDLRGELERLHAASFGWSLACCRRRREDAEDVLQTSYLKVLEGRARFDGRSSFKTFLFGVIARTAAEHRRTLWRASLPLERGSRIDASSGADPESAAAASQDAERLLHALARLSSRQRRVLELVFYHDLTVEAAASVLAISVGSARVHYERGKKRLGRVLDE
jgi:RNA polymerase sigma factor (sigma-70 family)